MKTESEFLRLGLRAGFVMLEEIEKWAAEKLESTPDQEDVLTELTIARVNGKYESGQLLGQILGDLDGNQLEGKIRARIKDVYSSKGKVSTIPLIEGLSIAASELPRQSDLVHWSSILDDRRQLFLDGLCDFSEVEARFNDFLFK